MSAQVQKRNNFTYYEMDFQTLRRCTYLSTSYWLCRFTYIISVTTIHMHLECIQESQGNYGVETLRVTSDVTCHASVTSRDTRRVTRRLSADTGDTSGDRTPNTPWHDTNEQQNRIHFLTFHLSHSDLCSDN